jgi:hypothetical protein
MRNGRANSLTSNDINIPLHQSFGDRVKKETPDFDRIGRAIIAHRVESRFRVSMSHIVFATSW